MGRTALAEPVDSMGAFRFEARITRTEAQSVPVLASLVTHLPNGKDSIRSLDGETCGEVVAALAVIIALTLDPGAQCGPLTLPVPVTETTPRLDDTSASASASTNSDAAPAAAVASVQADPPIVAQSLANAPTSGQFPPTAPQGRSVELRRRALVVTATPQTQTESGASAWGQLTLGLEGDWTSLLAPGLGMLRAGAHVTWHARSGLVATIGAIFGPTTQRSNGQGEEARFDYRGGAVELGWHTLAFSSFTLDSLAVVSMGQLHAKGVQGGRIAEPGERRSTWLGAGPALELRQHSNWGGWAIQASFPIGLVLPSFNIQASDGGTDRFFRVPEVGIQLDLRLFVKCFG